MKYAYCAHISHFTNNNIISSNGRCILESNDFFLTMNLSEHSTITPSHNRLIRGGLGAVISCIKSVRK